MNNEEIDEAYTHAYRAVFAEMKYGSGNTTQASNAAGQAAAIIVAGQINAEAVMAAGQINAEAIKNQGVDIARAIKMGG